MASSASITVLTVSSLGGLRCRVGDIAIITPTGECAVRAPELAGKLVRIVRRCRPGEGGGHSHSAWEIQSLGGPLRVDFVNRWTGEPMGHEYRTRRLLDDAHLTPIRDETKHSGQLAAKSNSSNLASL